MLPIDQEIREAIINQVGNISISASAGTGKTHTTILKIKHEIKVNTSFQTFAAITFTKKAAKEIQTRLSGAKGDGFVGTNDNFVLKEIICPFMYDVYGREFKKELRPDYSSENQVGKFEDGIEKIKQYGYICKYADNKKNFSFQLALNILKRSEAARLYLQSKYYRIYIDEYQDSDKDMHNLFMYICDTLNILLFIVGDLKQSIYGWRGGYSKGFEQIISNSNFSQYRLRHNFRSVISIQNFSNMFMDDVRCDVRKEEFDNGVCCFAYRESGYAVEKIKEWIQFESTSAFLVRRNDDGKKWASELKNNDLEFTFISGSPLDNNDLESEHVWISRQLAYFLIKELYSEFDFYDEIPNSDSYNFAKIKTALQRVEKSMGDKEVFEQCCYGLYEILGYENSEKIRKEVTVLYQVINDEQYIPTYNSDKFRHVVTTIHSAKGLQYAQVIVLAENYNLQNEEDLNLHYVAVSRPEKRLLVLCNYSTFNGKAYCAAVKNNITQVNNLGIDVNIDDVAECLNSAEFSK
ncbi:UvrD-helicase domain-containing protein [[Clostridium] fimetarium]|uniref:Superfamily I DNA or RNA helicase n=1 Tax=[Clostridium] fimetarium TaxID=99656 RepID=A0A1I0Q0V2_9FIRM|nr:UvrD-helicase domain-containing protein [[Clostridium] fimetarium]SEW20490.1 Superfamily I DNA or RNA helicase [[Clostridium] fimetarium]